MSRAATLAQLREDVQNQADVAGATTRTTPSLINRLLNQAVQRFRERISAEGSTHYLTSTTGTLGVGATSPYPFYVLDLTGVSPGIVRTYGVDVTVNSEVISLSHVSFNDRDKYGGPNNTDIPAAWSHFSREQLAILPPSSGSYPYVVWYLPVLADMTSDGSSFDGVAGWEEFVTWDVVCRIIVRDQYPTAYQMAVQYRTEIWADIMKTAPKVTSAGGGVIGRDTMGARLRGRLGR